MNDTFVTVTLKAEACCKCGIVFGMSAETMQRRRNDHDWFYCPNGHAQHYTGKSEAEKLREELERQKRCCESGRARAASLTEALEHRERQIRGYKGAVALRRNQIKRLESVLAGEIEQDITEAEQAIAAETQGDASAE